MTGTIVLQATVSFCYLGVNLRNQGEASTHPSSVCQQQGKKGNSPRIYDVPKCRVNGRKLWLGERIQSLVCRLGASKSSGKVNGKPQQRKESGTLEDSDLQE